MDFDFVEHVREFRYRRWHIDNVGTRISKVFALQFVFGLRKNKTLRRVTGRLNGIRRKWIARLRELVGSELWLPVKGNPSPYHPDFDFKKFSNAFRRCMHCRPTVVHFYSKDGRSVKIRPCWRTHICPFCWANITIAQYVYVKNAVNKLVKHDNDLVAVCRIVREYVPAPNFDIKNGTDSFQVAEHAALLRNVIEKHKARYTRLVAKKKIQRKTLGSLWRIVVIPDEAGWQVEIRQFFVHKAGVKVPVLTRTGSRVVLNKSIRLSNERLTLLEDFYNLFGYFCQYPIGLLTGYNQLVAAYLNATHNIRLISGTGAFVKTGRALIQYMREYSAHAKAKKFAKRAAMLRSQDASDPPTSPVHM
ncbi:hypothetical protein EBZ39_00530 [bacterium]|nr:hypothetical protein [bacterium]